MRAKFTIGQTVRHRLFDYRGVIYDVDPTFSLTQEWYEQVARSRPPKNKPWYRVLVDESEQETYVAERNLETDPSGGEVRHPGVSYLFNGFKDGVYVAKRRTQ